MRVSRFLATPLTVIALGGSSAACTFDGIGSIPLPGNTSGSTYSVEVELADADNLVTNSPVKAGNVTIGNVSRIKTDGWKARVSLDLNHKDEVPGNVQAKLGQTSLLGSQYIELSVPDGQRPNGLLKAGTVIPMALTAAYPPAEQVLSALSLVLNGSALQQLQTITDETSRVLDGHQTQARELIPRLRTFVDRITAQREDITRAIDSLASLGKKLADDKDTLARGITTLGPAVEVLNGQRENLVKMLSSLGAFGDAATGVLNASRDNLITEVKALTPILKSLSESRNDIPEALKVAITTPFSVDTVDRTIRGDYVNLFLTVDISPGKLASTVIPSLGRQQRGEPPTYRQSVNPLTAPVESGRGGRR
ncbi:MCE family protein [Tsukamurella paurometabola]|uniref:MCE family protein n=1 Tax=Tsukamurella paurometabola TaxID=2061 RepID=A0ABS5NFC9_TSUPA|nr:MCE family protein [Tsukamurella paurometabola]MBS4102990.1 MCE family protein [Tsukamurella paurometabola]